MTEPRECPTCRKTLAARRVPFMGAVDELAVDGLERLVPRGTVDVWICDCGWNECGDVIPLEPQVLA